MTHQRSGAVDGEEFIEFMDTQFVTGHIQRTYRFYMFRNGDGKPHKTMWVTDLNYVKKERDRCLELLQKKSQRRSQETMVKFQSPSSTLHPRVGQVPHGLVLSSSRFLSN
ncbi:unnamed protein product [Symbiodinium natans]|uniref:Uncharacterized protein n=1 Tax=Symbiodinium natans TaxID=878477 RepID=A0A812MSP0_9DINO|nr:unnamed protein product [Symbiodinium natans]